MVTSKEKVILEWGSEQESEYSEEDKGDDEEVDWISTNEEEEKKDDTYDDKSINLEMTDDEETDDKNGDEENTDASKMDAGKTEEVKDDAKRVDLPPTSSSLSVSLGLGDQFLKLSSDTSLVSTVKDTTDAKINSLLDIKIQYKVLRIQSSSILIVHVLVISQPVVPTPIPLDTAYGRRVIRRIGNYLYAFSCEELALIRRISFLDTAY
nr:hypothetical protein [Tanacetum cinerariifolium]